MKSNVKTWFSRSLSVILAVLIAFQVTPSRAAAIDAPIEQPQTSIAPPILPKDDVPPAQIVGEETNLRSTNTKHFRRSDGSFIAATYPQPVHYKDRSGNWQEIDNTLIENGDSYAPKASGAELSLPKTLGDGQEIMLGGDGYSLGIGIDSASDEAIVLKENTQNIENLNENQEAISIENLASGIYYPSAFENADLQYIIEPDKLKENVIVREKQDEYVYDFTLNLNGLTAAPQKDGTILLKDAASGALKYTIEAPIAYDANGVSVTDVLTLSLVENVLTLTADSAWMNDEGRAFPVVLDPTFIKYTDASAIKQATVSSTLGRSPSELVFKLTVGHQSTIGITEITRTYMQFDLPELPNCGIVTNAGVALDNDSYQSGGDIGVYKVTGSWAEEGIFWGNEPPVDNKAMDVEKIEYHSNGYDFDVTDAVKYCYEAGAANYGFMLKLLDENVDSYVKFATLSTVLPLILTNGEEIAVFPIEINMDKFEPVFWVSYVNNVGLEDFWSYESVELGRSGGLYVNRYNGGLTYLHNDVALSGERMPLSLSHTYVSDHNYADADHWGMRFGTGFKLSLFEEIMRDASTNGSRYYMLMDGDGTAHYFEGSGTTYTNELNSSIHLKKVGGNFELTDEIGNKKVYFQNSSTDHYYLTQIIDTNGNIQTINYDKNVGRISSITDPIGRVISLAYDNDGYLTTIKDPNNNTITYSYDKSLKTLTGIKYPDEKETKFTYETKSDNNDTAAKKLHLSSVQDMDGLYYTIAYDALRLINNTNYRVNSISQGEGSYKTIVISNEKNQLPPDPNGFWVALSNIFFVIVWLILLCPSWLKIDKYGNWYIDGKQPNNNYGTETKQEFSLTTLHTVNFAYQIGATVVTDSVNATQNTYIFDKLGRTVSVVDKEGNSGFTEFNNGDNQTNLPKYVAGATPVRNLLKNASNEFETSNWTGNATTTNDAYAGQKAWQLTSTGTSVKQEQSVSLGAGSGTHTLSFFVKTTDGTKAKLNYAFGAVTGTLEIEPGAEWERFSTTFAARGSGSVSISLEQPGSIVFDAVMLEKNNGTSVFNYVENSNFANAEHWSAIPANETAGDKVSGNAFVVQGKPNVEKAVVQDIPLNAKAGEMVLFGAAASAYAIDAPFKVYAEFFRANGTQETAEVNFNPDVKNRKQTAAKSYALQQDCTSMRLYICYYNQTNSLTIYDAFVFVGDFGGNFEYDSNGHLKKATTSNGVINYTYSNANLQKIQIQKPNGDSQTAEYTYDNQHNITKATEKGKQSGGAEFVVSETEYTYATGGVITKIKTTADGATTEQTVEHINDNNDVKKVIDGSGLWAEYQYASKNHNIVTTSTASDGSIYNYAYSGYVDMLTTIKSDVAQNSYGYEDEQLKSITHNGTTYSFSYNQLGQVLNAKIGSQVIAENTYNSATQRLSSTTYANGDSYTPRYDSLGRVIYEDFSGQSGNVSNGYAYANDGALTQVVSGETEKTTRFGYDVSGRLTDIHSFNTSDKNDSVNVRMKYDDKGALKTLKTSDTRGTLSQTNYEYDDRNRPSKTTLTSMGVGAVNYAYTGLDRLTLITHGSVQTSFTYWQNGANATNFITKMSNTLLGDLNYTYKSGDSRIATVSGAENHSYTYDKLGQLTKDNNKTYSYDNAGNLKTAFDGTATHTYAYENTNWKDQLTAFDGKPITYDQLGNPLTYDGMTFTWQKANQLKSITSDALNTSYKYDYSGLRTEKTVNGITTKYLWAGGLLMSQSDGTNTISWSYDASGTMVGFTLNGTPYFYLRNLQNDVVGIYDLDNNIVARYEYDAWGNVVSATNSFVANHNPIRYRGYYFDVESGYYYLQSRYYSPELARFVSADVYLDTGTSVIGTNMYAYCDNDPVNLCDPTGMLSYPGQIHNIVVDIIKGSYPGMEKEQTIKYSDGTWGRADLVLYDKNTNTAQIWDVKRDKESQIASGIKQVGKYITGTWKKAPRPKTKLERGGKILGNGMHFLIRNIGGETYYITYRDVGQGVIAYDYTKFLDDEFIKKAASGAGGAALIGASILLAIGSGGAAAPVIPLAWKAAEELLNAA